MDPDELGAGERRITLVVSECVVSQERLGGWLEDAGFEVLTCPGPSGPDGCMQLRGLRCPLAEVAQVVVLDLPLLGDPTSGSPPVEVLRRTYVDCGSAVVTVTDDPFAERYLGGDVVIVGTPLTAEAVRTAVERAAGTG